MIYLDHNATTPLDERVLQAMLPYLSGQFGNPSALYRLGRIAKSAIDHAREQVADLLDADPQQILFTSGGTEANVLALRQMAGRTIAVSAIEHPSVTANLPSSFLSLPVSANGIVDAECCSQSLLAGDWLVLMRANNETGALQSVADVTRLMAEQGVLVHCDAVQALGKIPLSFRQLGGQSMSVSSHKIYGPKGCGALVLAEPQNCQPLWSGGDQEQAMRAGTENVAAIVGFGAAAELAKRELQQRQQHCLQLRGYLEQQLKSLPGLHIFAEQAERLPNTVQFALPNQHGEMLVMQLDQQGIAVSSGSACASGSEQISPVLAAMGVDQALGRAAIRISLGRDSQQSDIDGLMAALSRLLA